MQTDRFAAWLKAEGLSERTIHSRLSTCRRLETHEGDLDEHFDSDGMRRLLDDLAYSTDDERRGAPPRHKVLIEGNIRNGSATLKNAATLYWQYRHFRADGDERHERVPSRPRHRQVRQVDPSASHQPTGTNSLATSQPREDQPNWAAVIADGESDRVEFKATLRKNTHTRENDDRMGDTVIKTIAGFLNTDGGTLFVGVKDDGSILGTDFDGFANEDKMSLHLTTLVNNKIERSAWAAIRANFRDVHGARVLVVECDKASSPAYVKQEKRYVFYMRTNNATVELSGRELDDYMKRRFRS